MTISLFWNRCLLIAVPHYSMPSSGVFLCLDSISTVTRLISVNRKKAKYRKIICQNLHSVIESRHLLWGVFNTPTNRGLLRNTDSSSELYWSVPILTTVEPLPVWPMFIDRIIVRIWFSLVALSSEPLNPHQFEASCTDGRGMRLPLTAKNPAIKRCPQCRHPCINQR